MTGGDGRWPRAGWDFSHFALFYRGLGEYAREVCTFVREGLSSAEPVLIAVPGRRPGRTRFVSEPVWPGRSAAEITEAARHEALVNAALAAVPATVMCPYDAGVLGAAVLDGARQTHPYVVEDGAPGRTQQQPCPGPGDRCP